MATPLSLSPFINGYGCYQGMGCERCGVIFMTLNHLMGHIKECCKGSKQAGTNQPMDEGSSTSGGENQEEGESVSDGENQEESAFYNFRLEAINRVRESKDWEDKYNDFVKAGEEEDNACELADGEFEKRIVKIAEKMYRHYLTNGLLLQYGAVMYTGKCVKPFLNIGIKDTTPGKPQNSL